MICPTCNGTGVVPDPGATGNISILTYGAKGDGIADDTAAIQQAFNSYRPGTVIVFPAGKTFLHSKVLSIGVSGTQIAGPGTLFATNESTSALRIAADYVTINNLTVTVGVTSKRWDAPAQAKIHLDHTNKTKLINVTVDGSAASGIFVQKSSNYVFTDVSVYDTRADGIHNTGGSFNGFITRPVVSGTGDDGVAIVSYLGEPVCYNIRVTSPVIKAQKGGRGITVVGGRLIAITNPTIDSSFGAAIYIAAESEWNTYGCDSVVIEGGTLSNSNTDVNTDHGAVLIYSSQTAKYPNNNIRIKNLTIKNTRLTASRQVGAVQYGTAVQQNILMDAFTIVGGNKWLYSGNAPVSATRRTAWTWNGTPVPDALGW